MKGEMQICLRYLIGTRPQWRTRNLEHRGAYMCLISSTVDCIIRQLVTSVLLVIVSVDILIPPRMHTKQVNVAIIPII